VPGKGHSFRLHAFGEAGVITLQEPLPEQTSNFQLASVGVGGRMTLFNYLNGSVDAAIPLTNQTETEAYRPFMTFRVWADF
jgi:hemolysin activation/secretion protein